MVIYRPCKWCGCDMHTERTNKKLCSSKCHVAFHRWRQKVLPGEGPQAGFALIEQMLLENQHPNKKYQFTTTEEPTNVTTND